MFLDEEDLQKLGLKMLEGIRWRSSSIHDVLLQWHPDCQIFFFLCCFSAPQSDGTALLPFWMQILYPLSSSLLFFFTFSFQTTLLCSLSGRRLPLPFSAAATPFSGDCVDTQADCVDTTGFNCSNCFLGQSSTVDTQVDCVDTAGNSKTHSTQHPSRRNGHLLLAPNTMSTSPKLRSGHLPAMSTTNKPRTQEELGEGRGKKKKKKKKKK
ncbi:hypothetical protein Taro_006925 [Colocasia esculenta]|uniref:Uncharacterized protein n=1 Tax=Colocasia esculenta TaxID=4460 RepID=A0A843TYT3_COLES|nr:hypothetical protein [Colocasia esculenta]